MSNIVLTTKCNRKCKYCFADNSSKNHMVFQKTNFITAVDWLASDSSNIVNRIGLIGGEPTKHPKFIEFLDYILSKKMNTIVFTNGMVKNKDTLYDVIKIAGKNKVNHSNHLCFCLNMNETYYRSMNEDVLQEQFLNVLGKVTALSFNIFEPKCDLNFLIEIINKYKMLRTIRLGLAVPLKNKNKFLSPSEYNFVGKKITNFIKTLKNQNIKVDFDCGFTKCMFTEDQLSVINSGPVKTMSFDCGPIIDIYSNLEITNCYPLAKEFKVKLKDFSNYRELHTYWKEKILKLDPMYKKCYSCTDFNNGCNGGCKAHKLYG